MAPTPFISRSLLEQGLGRGGSGRKGIFIGSETGVKHRSPLQSENGPCSDEAGWGQQPVLSDWEALCWECKSYGIMRWPVLPAVPSWRSYRTLSEFQFPHLENGDNCILKVGLGP